MHLCESCKSLLGKPSSNPPHSDLSPCGAGMFGTTTNPIKLYSQYKCTVCGNWLFQTTEADDEPNVWRTGGAPSDIPNA
jgi:hypothetical protein